MSIRPMRYIGLAGVLLLPFAFAAARAQDPASTSGTRSGSRALCWRARPAPHCARYLVTEFAYERAIASTKFNEFPISQDFGGRFVWSVGPMTNKGPNAAWGVLASVALDDDPEEFAPLRLEGRYRRWTGERSGVDLAAGVAQKAVYHASGTEQSMAHGVTAAVGVAGTYFGADARVDWLYGGGQARRAVHLGIRTGSRAAPIATAVVGLFGFILYMGISGGMTT